MNRIGHFGDSLPSLPVSHFIFLWFSTCESIFTYFAQFWPLALGEAQTSSSPNWCNVIVSRHLCWDTCPHYKLNFSHHFSKKQLLLMWSCRYSPQHQSLVTSLCPASRPNQSWKDTYDEKGGKKDWNCSEMHFCSENICILCGGHAQKKKKRNTLCSQPFSPDMVCFDAIQHSTVVSSSIPVQGRNLLANQSPLLARQHFLLWAYEVKF